MSNLFVCYVCTHITRDLLDGSKCYLNYTMYQSNTMYCSAIDSNSSRKRPFHLSRFIQGARVIYFVKEVGKEK